MANLLMNNYISILRMSFQLPSLLVKRPYLGSPIIIACLECV